MKPSIPQSLPINLNRNRKQLIAKASRPVLMRVGAILILAGLLVSSFYSRSSASQATREFTNPNTNIKQTTPALSPATVKLAERMSPVFRAAFNPVPLPAPPPGETIETFDTDCTTPKASFAVGETVCVKVSGVPVGSFFPRRLLLSNSSSTVIQSFDVTSDPQTFSFVVDATTTIGGSPVDNRGQWQAIILNPFFYYPESSSVFTVADPDNATADVGISTTSSPGGVQAGTAITFELQLKNYGPDSAATVALTDAVPANTTFVDFQQVSGPTFTCTSPASGGTGTTTCTIASLDWPGPAAEFVATYQVNPGTTANTVIVNTANITSTTNDQNIRNDSTSDVATVTATPAGQTCMFECPANIVATSTGPSGAIVNFASAINVDGDCGAISASPNSGSLFPIGVTTVNVSSESGPSCSFTVTVVDTPAPTISCPADKIATADGTGFATVSVGAPSTSPGTGVTVVGRRSDDTPAVYDEDGQVVTPEVIVPLSDPYPIGTTGITWTVTDDVGRTATCTQRIVVHTACASDTAPPTITAPADITVGTGANSTTCGVVLDDELGQAVADDDCSAVVSTSGVPAGNLFPIGTTVITYTATDGAGHSASDTQTIVVTDNTPPTIAAPADATYVCASEVPAASPSQAHGTDPNLPNGGPVADNCGSPIVTVSQTSSGAGSAASPLVITRTYTATDSHGNSASSTQTITVIDPTPPTFTFVPANVTAFTGPGAITCGTVVSNATLGTATATDNCSVTVTRSGVPAGNVFPKGNTTVTYTATDAAGNSTSATQTVTVIDNTPPTISCTTDIIADYNSAVNGAVVTYTAPSGSDNCAGATTAQIAGLASGSTFPLGTTTNTFRVTDAAGNTAECSFKVTVALTSIVGLDSVSISGAALVDSYDSNGSYASTKGNLANVLSNGTITLAGSGKVGGNVRSTRAGINMSGASQITGNATAGTTVTRTGSATVGGTITNNALAPVMTLPPVPACGPPYSSNSGISGTYSYNASTGDLTLSGVNIATLANGNYCFHNVTLTNSAQLKVNGPVVIKLTGTLNTGGATSLPNTTLVPSNLRVLSSYSGTNGVTFGNSASLQLVVYAPQTAVNISGSAPLFGTVAGKSITLSNSGMIHYDTRLKNIWPAVWLLLGP
jgi:uncharacterized repeat protein (TIGR01451 family)